MYNNNDYLIAKQLSRRGGLFHRAVRYLTRFAWTSQLDGTVNRLYEQGLLGSRGLHTGSACVDVLVGRRGHYLNSIETVVIKAKTVGPALQA